jgi:hypothetical protein
MMEESILEEVKEPVSSKLKHGLSCDLCELDVPHLWFDRAANKWVCEQCLSEGSSSDQ